MALVSVIMPVYNAGKYLEDALNSVLAQTMRDFELLVINDGSTDESACIAQRYAEQDARVQLITQTNGGVSKARNEGLARAKGEYLCFIDADDEMDATLLEKVLETAHETEADIVEFGFYKEIYGRKHSVQTVLPRGTGVVKAEELPAHFTGLWGEASFPLYSHLFRRGFVEDLRFNLVPIAEDVRYIMDALARAPKLAFCAAAYYHYAVRLGSAANRYQPRRLECDLALIDGMERLTKSLGCDETETQTLLQQMRVNAFLNELYNLCLPGVPGDWKQRRAQMNRAAETLGLSRVRKNCRTCKNQRERIKYFCVRHRLENLLLLFGPAFVRLTNR